MATASRAINGSAERTVRANLRERPRTGSRRSWWSSRRAPASTSRPAWS